MGFGVWLFSLAIGVVSYHSIGVKLFPTRSVSALHYFFWPWFLFVFGGLNKMLHNGVNEHAPVSEFPKPLLQNIVLGLWVFVQIGLLLAKFHVEKWANWYGFMQGFHIFSLMLYGFSRLKCGRFGSTRCTLFSQAAAFHVLVSILSYHSIISLCLAGDVLIHASVWPYIVSVVLMIVATCSRGVSRNEQN